MTRLRDEIARDWQPMGTAPRDGDDFLAIDRDNGFAQVVFYDPVEDKRDWWWAVADGVTYHREAFTHWMPLPDVPSNG